MTRVELNVDSAIAVERSWRGIYLLGAIAAILVLVGTLSDIVIASLPGWETTTTPATPQGWFDQLQTNPLLGLRNLDLLNLIISAIGIPMYLALYGALRRVSQAPAALALLVVLVGTALFFASNAALPMMELSKAYAAASTDAERLAMEAGAYALLARGAHGSMGAFIGFFLSSLGTLLMGFAMLNGRVFRRAAAALAIVGTTLLIAYTIGATFTPTSTEAMMVVALPGGLAVMAWYVIVARKLLRLRGER